MKKILCAILCVCSLMLTACSSYTRDDDSGELNKINLKEMQRMIDDKESFAIVFTQTTCGACQTFHEMLDTYLLNHNITLYEVVLDEETDADISTNLKTIRKTFKGFKNTPSLYYVKEGTMENQMSTENDAAITEERFDSWVQEYKLDEKK